MHRVQTSQVSCSFIPDSLQKCVSGHCGWWRSCQGRAGSQGPSHHLSQEQGSWRGSGAAPALDIGQPSGDRTHPTTSVAGGALRQPQPRASGTSLGTGWKKTGLGHEPMDVSSLMEPKAGLWGQGQAETSPECPHRASLQASERQGSLGHTSSELTWVLGRALCSGPCWMMLLWPFQGEVPLYKGLLLMIQAGCPPSLLWVSPFWHSFFPFLLLHLWRVWISKARLAYASMVTAPHEGLWCPRGSAEQEQCSFWSSSQLRDPHLHKIHIQKRKLSGKLHFKKFW